jgi:hypothetical protein
MYYKVHLTYKTYYSNYYYVKSYIYLSQCQEYCNIMRITRMFRVLIKKHKEISFDIVNRYNFDIKNRN